MRRRWVLLQWRLSDWAWEAQCLPEILRDLIMPMDYQVIKMAHEDLRKEGLGGGLWFSEKFLRMIEQKYWEQRLRGE